ncbi:hypothetical protein ACQP1G_06165 [Nocardia sp. CA-107356]|uniref:hypothetical protein n=1 Tax=Nocardia sp. CA-107356 TaxID=3239972 RepID=UPI003D8B7986
MTTPQNPERDDATPEQPADHKSAAGEPEPLESAGTDWAAPAASGPWESSHVEPAAPLPPQSDAPDSAAQPESAGPDAQTPDQRAAAETAPDLVAQPPPPWRAEAEQPYPPGTVYPPIRDTAPESPYGRYPAYTQQPYQPYSTAGARSDSQTLSIIAFVCAGISLLFCPYLFGPAGIILGIIGHKKGESLGKWAAITSAISLIVGFILIYAVFSGNMTPDTN